MFELAFGDLMIRLIVPSFVMMFTLVVLVILVTWRDHVKLIRRFSIKSIISFLVIALILISFWMVSPHFHSMWLDESLYAASARSIIELNDPEFELYNQEGGSKFNFGWSLVIAVFYIVFGIKSSSVFLASLVTFLASLFLIFLISKLIFKKDVVSVLAVLITSVSSPYLIWMMRAESNMAGLFFALLTFYFILQFNLSKNSAYFFAIVPCFFFSMSSRVEQLFLVIPFGFYIIYSLHNTIKLKGKLDVKILINIILSFILFIILFSVLSLPQLDAQSQGLNAPEMYSLSSMFSNFSFQFPRFFSEFMPVGIFAFAIVGFIFALRTNRMIHISLLIWFWIYFLFWPSRIIDWNQPRYYITIIWIASIYAASLLCHFKKIKIIQIYKIPILLSAILVFIMMSQSYFYGIYSETYPFYLYDDIDLKYDMDENISMVISSYGLPNLIQETLTKDGFEDYIIVSEIEEAIFLYGESTFNVVGIKTTANMDELLHLKSNITMFYYEGMLVKFATESSDLRDDLLEYIYNNTNLTLYRSFELGNTTADLYYLTLNN